MPANPTPGLTYKAAFLGPRGENAAEMEQLMLDVLRDHVFWRRNFHPEDPRLVRESERNDPNFARTYAHLRDELFQILARLKNAAPLHSPRQIAHIVSDPSIPALVGYFAGMLYNQNNVVQEVAPETVRREREYIEALARMVAYPLAVGEHLDAAGGASTRRSFGHLCSGGTTANIEALWVARNVRFFPLSLRLLLRNEGEFGGLGQVTFVGRTGERLEVGRASTRELIELPTSSILDLYGNVKAALAEAEGSPAPDARAKERAKRFESRLPTVQKLGMAAFLNVYNEVVGKGERIERLPAVVVPVTSHYCWKKAMDLIGLGSGEETLVEAGVDHRIRLSVPAVREKLEELGREQRPVLMVVSVCGTTEEAAVDPVHEICRLGQDSSLPAFWHHCDAALGGFFASFLPRRGGGEPAPFPELSAEEREALPVEEEVYRAIGALGQTDSLALDPHKFGYVPYPCGAVLFRDHAVRDFIAHEAPYLAGDRQDGFGGFLGKWTLEGSRSGAAAVSCYLSQAVLPLDPYGHGRLVANCVRATKALFRALRASFEAEGSRVAFCSFGEAPDTTGFCFALVPRHEELSLAELNAFSKQVWETMTVKEDQLNVGEYAFLISKSEVMASKYPQVLETMFRGTPLAPHTGRSALQRSVDEVRLLRVFVLNPFLSDWIEPTADVQERFDTAFSRYVYDTAHRLLPPFLLDRFVARSGPKHRRRLRVLVVEDEELDADSIAKIICFGADFSRYLTARTIRSVEEAQTQSPSGWDKVVLDLRLHATDAHDLSGILVARRLLRGGFRPDQFVVYSRYLGSPQVREELLALGLREDQIIEKPPQDIPSHPPADALRVLLERLVTGVLLDGKPAADHE